MTPEPVSREEELSHKLQLAMRASDRVGELEAENEMLRALLGAVRYCVKCCQVPGHTQDSWLVARIDQVLEPKDEKVRCLYCQGYNPSGPLRPDCRYCHGKGLSLSDEPTSGPADVDWNDDPCPTCEGSGRAEPTPGTQCGTCDGWGAVAVDFGLRSTGTPRLEPCEKCAGSGRAE